jgi:hypothetical protein
MVPTLTCGLSRSNFSFATFTRSSISLFRLAFEGEPGKSI